MFEFVQSKPLHFPIIDTTLQVLFFLWLTFPHAQQLALFSCLFHQSTYVLLVPTHFSTLQDLLFQKEGSWFISQFPKFSFACHEVLLWAQVLYLFLSLFPLQVLQSLNLFYLFPHALSPSLIKRLKLLNHLPDQYLG